MNMYSQVLTFSDQYDIFVHLIFVEWKLEKVNMHSRQNRKKIKPYCIVLHGKWNSTETQMV